MPYRQASSPPHGGRPCPHCSQERLVADRIGPTEVERCLRCHGLWVPVAEFNDLLMDLDRQDAVRAAEPLRPSRPDADGGYRKCPRCSQIMDRRIFGKSSGIMVDTCRTHGIWLDRGELRRIVEFLDSRGADEPSPSLDRAIYAATAAERPRDRERARDDMALFSPSNNSLLDDILEFLLGLP